MSARQSKTKPMDIFARETFKLGTLRGFRHFHMELRGREELLLTIDVQHSALAGSRLALAPMAVQHALPPASPCQREKIRAPWEDAPEQKSSTLVCYLLAGYAHYACPHAWVRSGHGLFGPSFQNSAAMDAPIEMRATQDWKARAVHAFEFVAELVLATSRPAVANPFELDFATIEQLPSVELLLLSGGLASFLRDVQLSAAPYSSLVEADLLRLTRLHYSRLPKLVASLPSPEGGDPPLVSRRASSLREDSRSSPAMARTPHTPYVPPHGSFGRGSRTHSQLGASTPQAYGNGSAYQR